MLQPLIQDAIRAADQFLRQVQAEFNPSRGQVPGRDGGFDQSVSGAEPKWGFDGAMADVAGAVRTTLGTLLLGGTYRFSDRMSLNVALGVGVTRDTPDLTLTARVPINF